MSQQINILCLHGRQQTGTLFSRRISTLTKRAKQFDKDVTFSFFFIDAPFILPMKEGDTVNVRAWWNNDKDPEGYAKSVAMIDELWKKHSFDAVLGFSQGAAVGAALCVARYPSLKCAVLVSPPDSGDWIFDGVESIRARNATSKQNGKGLSKFANETISTLGSASASSSSLSPVQIMIVAGHNDKLVSVDSSKALGERCIARDSEKVLSYVVLEHELGHLVPTKFFDEIIQFISNNCARSFDAQISSGHAVAIKSEKKTNTSQKASSVQSESSAKTPLSSSSSLAASVPMKSSKPEKNQKIEKKIFTVTSQEIADMQREEIESLSAIFGDTDAPFTCNDKLPSKSGEAAPKIVLHLLKVSNLDSNESEKGILGKWKRAGLNLSLQLTSNYPLIEPLLVDNVDSETLSNVELPDDTRLKIVDAAKSVANQNIGFGSIYSIYMAVEELLPSLAAEVGSGTVKAIETPSNESSSNENEEEIDIGSTSLTDQVVSEVEEEKMIIEATTEAAKSYKNNGNKPVNNGKKPGVYSVVVGLVGKPNAGKSTFFNCVTRAAMELDSRRQAQVGAYPFTTIEPNFGVGLFRPEWSEAAVDSSQTKDQKTSATASSSSSSATTSSEYKSGSSAESNTNRLLPILVKDVAGLVPGAWKGLGKGNKFLNDLLDADILVHVCDASGKSNANGVIVGPNMGGTTVKEDAQWIRLEIHRWIAANVISKWDSVSKWRRKSSSTRTSKQFEGDKIQSRVCSLFTGYHCRAQFVHAAAEFAGLNLATADQWRREDVHRLVAFFISYRFPIFLALNKIDTIGRELSTGDSETAKTFIDEKILEEALYTAKENGDCALPVSGGVESFLLQSSAQNLIDYEIGSATFALLDEGKKKYSTDKKFKEEVDIAKFVMDKYHGTGVLNAISYAVKLCFPIYVFPIPPNTGTGLNPHLISRQFLSDCIIVTPGTSMEEVYEILHRGSVTTCSFRLDGDLVRIEAKSLQEVYSDADCTIPWHQLSKDVLVNSSNAVVRIFTNRKVAWQQQLGATGKDKSNTNGKR